MKSAFRILFGATCIVATSALTASADITLKTKDGNLQVTGVMESFDGINYIIRTGLGTFSIPADAVDCIGDDCPSAAPANEMTRTTGSDLLVATLLPEAVRSFARDAGAGFQVSDGSDGSQSYEVTDIAGNMVATMSSATDLPSSAFDQLLRGQTDVVLASRRITNSEVEAFLDAGFGDLTSPEQERIVAQDGLVAVVAPQNPVRSLTVSNLEGIFSGRITNWSQVGGPNLPIRVIAPADGSGEAAFFFDTVLDPEFADYGPRTERVNDLKQISQLVAADVSAIGLTSTAHVQGVADIALAGDCGLVTEATPFNIKAEDYPLSRRLYAYTTSAGARAANVTSFIDMFEGATGQDAAERTGLTSLAADATSLDGQGRRFGFALADREQQAELQNLRGFAEEVFQAYRLSTTFRFSSGSSQLDNKARADAERLAAYLALPENRDREVLLIGFTDSIGQSTVNTVLSVRRAQQVLDEIIAGAGNGLDTRRIQVLGYGASAPIGCNTTDAGRQLNRRVEVWLR